MRYLSHVDMMREYIDERLQRGIDTFTHKDISRVTNANCSYSLLRELKKYYIIDYEDITKKTRKKDKSGNVKYVNISFRQYTIRRKEKDVKESNIWGESQTGYYQALLLGEGAC